MELKDIMKVLQVDMGVAVFATVDENNRPHARHAHVGVANEQGVFFMTSPKTDFYQQLKHNPNVAITSMSEDGYLIQVIRVEGKVKEIGKEYLEEVLKDNPYVKHVYPTEADQMGVQVFHLHRGKVFYHSLTQGHKYEYRFGE